MVAPSFQSYKVIIAEPFLKNGKLYITVEHPNTHNHRDVRWYSDKEYQRAYGKSNPISLPTPSKISAPAAVRSLEIISKDPLTIKARVAASSLPKACVLIWQACGAAGIKSYQAP